MLWSRLFYQAAVHLLLFSTNEVTAAPRTSWEHKPQKSSGNNGNRGSIQPVVYPSTWGYNTGDVSILQPNHNGHLYYTKKGENSRLFQSSSFSSYFSNSVLDPGPSSLVVHLNVSFPAPTVILDHSSFVANVSTNNNTIIITFTNLKALQYAYRHWKRFSELILVTKAVSNDGQREYFLVTLSTWNKAALGVTYTANLLNPSDCLGQFTANWGTPGNPGSPPVNTQPGSSGNDHSSSPGNDHPGSPGNDHHGSPPGNSGPSTTTQSYESSTPNPTVCSKPTSSVIDGLPAAPCGYYFDEKLDQDIGYYSFSGPQGTQALSSFAPGVTGVVPSDLYVPAKKRRALQAIQKRSFGSWLRSVVHVGFTSSRGQIISNISFRKQSALSKAPLQLLQTR
jgi:hypothetical protein